MSEKKKPSKAFPKARKAGVKKEREALLGGLSSVLTTAKSASTRKEAIQELAKEFMMVPLNKIRPNKFQPRQDFDPDALQELADSIREFGVIQPITVRYDEGSNSFELISGERRWRASKLAGLKEVPAYIRTPNDQELMEMALVENLFREDLNPIEIALTYGRLMEEFKLTQEEVARRVERGRTTVTNFLRLLKLGDFAKKKLREEVISMGHAKALLSIDNVATQRKVCEEIISQDLSVRAAEKLVRQYRAPGDSPGGKSKKGSTELPAEYRPVVDNLRARFGSKQVRLELKSKGKGQIVIPFQSDAELNDLLDRLEE